MEGNSETVNCAGFQSLNGQMSGDVKLQKSKSENDKLSDNASSHSQLSRSNKSAASSSATAKGSTKVYYHIDDEPTPYCTDVPASADKITLAAFKSVLNRTNFKFYCKANDPEVGGQVKVEIRDDQQLLFKSCNGQFELFLLTAEGSSHSDGASSANFSKLGPIKRTVPGPAPLYPIPNSHLYRPRYRLDNHIISGNRHKAFEDSTIYTTETEGRIYSDDESRLSTSTDNITSVSRQHYSIHRRRRRQNQRTRRQPSRTSSLSSMTETSMALEVITVTLNMNTVNFLGISIVGQSCPRGDSGIYVANVMPGGAVALDGRIEPGDMILQVNDISFENFKNDQAVEVLKRAVNTRGPIKLTVAKSFDANRTNYFSVPSREPVRPIDTHAWVQHTNAVRGMTSTLVNAMNAIPEGSEGTPTPIPSGHFPPTSSSLLHTFAPPTSVPSQRPASSSTSTGSGGGAAQTIVGPGGVILSMQQQHRLDVHSDKRKVIQTLAMPNSGLDIRDRTWLKIPIPRSFLGSALIDWLIGNVDGLDDRKEARKYASGLLKDKFIAHVVNKVTFTEQCYYIFGEQSAELLNLRASFPEDGTLSNMQNQFQHMEIANPHQQGTVLYSNRAQEQPNFIQPTNLGAGTSMISEYASMPSISPYPAAPNIYNLQNAPIAFPPRQQAPNYCPMPMSSNSHNKLARVQQEQFGATTSQTSNNSNDGSSGSEQRRKAVLPPVPSLTSVGPHNPTFPLAQQRHPPAGPPPTTPIGDEGMQRTAGQHNFKQKTENMAQGRIRLSENFPEVLVEHF